LADSFISFNSGNLLFLPSGASVLLFFPSTAGRRVVECTARRALGRHDMKKAPCARVVPRAWHVVSTRHEYDAVVSRRARARAASGSCRAVLGRPNGHQWAPAHRGEDEAFLLGCSELLEKPSFGYLPFLLCITYQK
jgi:hypothetical protein